jgi:ribosomal protein S18 acetylase RimI-like enzyme
MVEVSIRLAVAADMPALSDVYRRSSFSNEGDRPNLLAHPDALTLSDIPVAQQRLRVAVVDDRIVGFATLLLTEHVGELEDLFVDPDWTQLGVGRALVRDAVDIAAVQGVTRIEVTANGHARDFYEKVGFVLEGVSQTRFGPADRMHLDVLLSP